MNIKELVEAVERYRSDLPQYAHNYDAAQELIADAFTDPAPITREVLEALGFANRKPLGKAIYQWIAPDQQVIEAWEHNGGFNFTHTSEPVKLRRTLLVEPQTRGDLAFLLWRLSRVPPNERKG